jgi:hypothetical protein
MKKKLAIITLLLFSTSVQANDRDLLDFGKWLNKNNLNNVSKINEYESKKTRKI